MAEAGVSAPLFVEADFTVAGGHRAAARLLDATEPPTAIFAASDEMAYGVLAAARERGIAVPGDLSVIGVDGHDLAGLFDLTTINQFPHAQGERTADALLGRIADRTADRESAPASGTEPSPDPRASDTALPFALVVRGTTGPLPR